MSPANFPQANCNFGPPADLEESQCMTIQAYAGRVQGGSLDGARQVVVAWQPTPEDIERIKAGAPIFLSCIGGLPPHFLTTQFEQATRIA